jgi:N-acyl-D-amino-acid deacylase
MGRMRHLRLTLLLAPLLLSSRLVADTTLIRGGMLVDGTGSRPRRADVRIDGEQIVEIGRLRPRSLEAVIDAKGLVVAPGFIDTHSHASIAPGPLDHLLLLQGITTAVVGQDGSHHYPLAAAVQTHAARPTPYNVASFVGHGTIRTRALGADQKRKATGVEMDKMARMVEAEMEAGGFGLSSGLEYDPGYYATTDELISCAKAAARSGGFYISHMRNEDNTMFDALDELIRIAREAGCPAQISHIKLGSRSVWDRAGEVLRCMEEARRSGVDVTADVYPYLYWQSSITVLIPTRDWSDRAAWKKGLDDVGGPENVLLGRYSPDKSWEGKNLAELASLTGKDAVSVVQEIVQKTRGPGANGTENVVVKAMKEEDLRAFLKDPHIMICTDGAPGGSHPRAAGTYPRVLGRYVREEKVLSLQEAVRKMTSLPAKRMGFADRGTLRAGLKADVVVFDPTAIIDRATTSNSSLPSVGVRYLFVNGAAVLREGKPTGASPGKFLRHPGRPPQKEVGRAG